MTLSPTMDARDQAAMIGLDVIPAFSILPGADDQSSFVNAKKSFCRMGLQRLAAHGRALFRRPDPAISSPRAN